MKKITENAYLLEGPDYGTNIGALALNGDIYLIDPMPGVNYLSMLENSVKQIFGKSAGYILNTHTHEDHSGGNDFFAKNGARLLAKPTNNKDLEHFVVASHSSSDNIYYHKPSNMIFVGDVFDTSWHPTFYYGGIKGFNAAIDAILAIGDKNSLLVPGHGKPADKASLREYRNNTMEWITTIESLHLKNVPAA